jgi:hypothetical protein
MKASAPNKSFAGYVWQVNTSLSQGSRLSILAFYKSDFDAGFEEHKVKVREYWKTTVTKSQGGGYERRKLPSSIPDHLVINSESGKRAIDVLAVSMTKTQLYMRPKLDNCKTVGHGQIS